MWDRFICRKKIRQHNNKKMKTSKRYDYGIFSLRWPWLLAHRMPWVPWPHGPNFTIAKAGRKKKNGTGLRLGLEHMALAHRNAKFFQIWSWCTKNQMHHFLTVLAWIVLNHIWIDLKVLELQFHWSYSERLLSLQCMIIFGKWEGIIIRIDLTRPNHGLLIHLIVLWWWEDGR